MTSALPNGAFRRIHGGLTSSLLMLGLSLPLIAQAADEASVLRARAASLASKGDCEAALPLVDQARALDPAGEGASALMAGRCLISMKRFAEARPVLERAVEYDPSSGDARLALGVAEYHLGERDAARADLERAQTMLPNNPEAELYLGLILLEEDRPAEAIDRLERSRSLSGDVADPASDYYSALAHSQSGERRRAEESLRRVQETAPGTVWAERAAEALEQAEARRLAGRPARWLTASAGLDYDTNVALQSDAITQPNNISSKDDGRGWWALDGGAELFRKDGWSGGAGATYNGTHPFYAQSFDQHFVKANLWLDRELGSRTTLRISPEGGWGWFDEKSFFRYLALRPELRHDFGDAGLGTLYVRYAYNDFRYDEFIGSAPARNELDRDGHDTIVGYDHQIPVTDSLTLRGGVFGRHYVAEGPDYDFSGGGGWLGFRQILPLELIFSASGRVEYDDYQDETYFPIQVPPVQTDAREDWITRVNAVLTKPVNEWLSVSARYQYLNSESNTSVFDYDRHIVGAFFTVGLLR